MDKHNELEKVTEAMKQAKECRMYERYQSIYLHLKDIRRGSLFLC